MSLRFPEPFAVEAAMGRSIAQGIVPSRGRAEAAVRGASHPRRTPAAARANIAVMKYYPVFVRLTGAPCLVIGGGRVAERKVRGLLRAGARVTVVSPEATPGLARLAERGKLTWKRRRYRRGDARDCALVYAATSNPEVQAAVAEEARDAGAWVNAVDRPELCSFLAPAVVARGDLVIAVSTSGGSPLLARRVRQQLERSIGPEYGRAVKLLGAVRRRLAAVGFRGEQRRRVLAKLLDSPLLACVRAGNWERADRILARIAGPACRLSEIGFTP